MSAVSPGALTIFSLRYFPSPSWVIPRCTCTPRGLRGELRELRSCCSAPPRSPARGPCPPSSRSMSNAALNSMSAHVVAAEVDVHQPRHPHGGVGVAVVVHPLYERACAVAHPDDRHPHLVALVARNSVRRRAVAVAVAIRFSQCVSFLRGRARSGSALAPSLPAWRLGRAVGRPGDWTNYSAHLLG